MPWTITSSNSDKNFRKIGNVLFEIPSAQIYFILKTLDVFLIHFLLRNYIDSDFWGRFFNMKKNLCARNLEKYITNLPEIFVRVRRSYGTCYATTRLKFLCPTAEQCAPEKKYFSFVQKLKDFWPTLRISEIFEKDIFTSAAYWTWFTVCSDPVEYKRKRLNTQKTQSGSTIKNDLTSVDVKLFVFQKVHYPLPTTKIDEYHIFFC